MTALVVAWTYAVLCGATGAFHLAVAAGAPWGRATRGGRWPGRLPPAARALSVASATLLVAMARAALARAGAVAPLLPRWAWHSTVILTFLAVLANATTPSRPERRAWLPVTTLMVAALAVVAAA